MKNRPILIGILVLLLVAAGLVQWIGQPGGSNSTVATGVDVSALTKDAIPRHLEALKHRDAAVRQRAARALWQIGSDAKEATPALLEGLKDPVAEVRAISAKALGSTSQGTSAAVPALIETLRDEQVEVRAVAAASLAEIWHADKAGSSPLPRRPREEMEGEIRPGGNNAAEPEKGEAETSRAGQAPAVALPQLSPASRAAARPTIPVLIQALRDTDSRVRANAAEALGETGTLALPAVEHLIPVLQKDQDENARMRAAIALGAMGPEARDAVPALIEQLRNDQDDGVRANCAVALGKIHSDAEIAVPALVEAFLKEKPADIRGVALMALVPFGPVAPPIAMPALEALAKDPKNQQLPNFQKKADALREMLASRLKSK